MGKNLETQYAFRCDDTTIKKLEYIAQKNTRTRNQEMKHIIKQYVEQYESNNGEIIIEEAKEKKKVTIHNNSGNVIIGKDNNGTINM